MSKTYDLKMMDGDTKVVTRADHMAMEEGWFVFYVRPPQGGRLEEFLRVRLDAVISVETIGHVR